MDASYFYILGRISALCADSDCELSAGQQHLTTVPDIVTSQAGIDWNESASVLSFPETRTPNFLIPWSLLLAATSADRPTEGRYYGTATLLDKQWVLFTKHQFRAIDNDFGSDVKIYVTSEAGRNDWRDSGRGLEVLASDTGRVDACDLMVGRLAQSTRSPSPGFHLDFPNELAARELLEIHRHHYFCGWGSTIKRLTATEEKLKNDFVLHYRPAHMLPDPVKSSWIREWQSRYAEDHNAKWEDLHHWSVSYEGSPHYNDSGGGYILLSPQGLHLVAILTKGEPFEGANYCQYVWLPSRKAQIAAARERVTRQFGTFD